MRKPLIQVKGLSKHFRLGKNVQQAISNVTFNIYPREILGIVGESGSGKTTIGKLLLNIIKPTEGEILFENHSLSNMTKHEIRAFYKQAQMIFQNPYDSLNPRMTAKDIIEEPLRIYRIGDEHYRKRKVFELFESVGLDPSFQTRFPHEFSGGQRQRICIARSLALSPKFLVCDEPTAALDVSIQAQIINLLKRLQDTHGLTYLVISHNLALIKHICTRIVVMYYGQIVEIADTNELFNNPLHPYTKHLLASIPIPDPNLEKARLSKMEADYFDELLSIDHKENNMPSWHFSQNQLDPRLKKIDQNHFVQEAVLV